MEPWQVNGLHGPLTCSEHLRGPSSYKSGKQKLSKTFPLVLHTKARRVLVLLQCALFSGWQRVCCLLPVAVRKPTKPSGYFLVCGVECVRWVLP